MTYNEVEYFYTNIIAISEYQNIRMLRVKTVFLFYPAYDGKY